MTSPATDSETPRRGGGGAGRRLRVVLWLLGLLVAAPVIVTLFGAATSPPHVAGVPVGRLVYLDADQPSEKTTILRGLYVTPPGGGPPRLLVHEDEPQDSDSGVREWITEPAVSPDGTQVAYIKQDITLLEETHSQDNQIWVVSLNTANAKPRQLLDLTKLGFKQIVGLAWTADGKSVVFSQDAALYRVPAAASLGAAKPAPWVTLAPFAPLKTRPDISATQGVTLRPPATLAYTAQTVRGPEVIVTMATARSRSQGEYHTSAWALGDGQIAYVDPTHPAQIVVQDLPPLNGVRSFRAHWGWSLFGRRAITSLRWSPDGQYLAYTVGKPPIPEDELFYLNLADGKASQLPVRTGRAAWDWTR